MIAARARARAKVKPKFLKGQSEKWKTRPLALTIVSMNNRKFRVKAKADDTIDELEASLSRHIPAGKRPVLIYGTKRLSSHSQYLPGATLYSYGIPDGAELTLVLEASEPLSSDFLREFAT